MRDDEVFFRRIVDQLGLPAETSRRGFIRATVTISGLSAAAAWAQKSKNPPLVILENAGGILVTDTTRCVGCRRCELACTEFNEGRAQPALARIKVSRNYNYGPRSQRAGFNRSQGEFGNFRILQDTCLQCPHPVPCASACPNGAIVADSKTGARRVDPRKCTGCRLCSQACPWEMITFDGETKKASKCFLCDGKPECAEACPALALRYVPWRDLTHDIPIRQATRTILTDSAGCSACHREKKI
jgi:Fe-S-cluster-containing dehydrogenase component